MSYIQPKVDYKDGDVLHGIDLNASNEVIKAGVDDNFDRIQGLETAKQDVIDSSNKLDYSLLDNTPEIPTKVSDLTNDTGFITADYHDSTKQNVLTAGEGIQIQGDVISNTQTSAEWGNIQGNIEEQLDLMIAFDDKQDVIDNNNKLDYNLLDNTPTIPSKTSDLTNDSGFIDNTYHDNTKQDTLVSGTNIKTINNQNILGSGNISIGGGSGGTSDYDQLENRPQINNVTLSGNKSLSDLGINIPTKLSDLTNDNNTVTDANYVHTDSNFTTAEKTKLSGIETGAEVNEIDTIKVNNVAQPVSSKEVNITVPTNLSDLTNDNNTVTDANYVHTDNNYTSTEKTKLAGIEAGAQVNVDEILIGDESSATADTKLIIEESDLDFQGLDYVEDVYSTDEVKTNKVWIDGKPIYRKVIEYTMTNSPGEYPSVNTGITNVEHIFIFVERQYGTNNSQYVSGITEYNGYFDKSNGTFTFNRANTDATKAEPGNYKIILEYTKTS